MRFREEVKEYKSKIEKLVDENKRLNEEIKALLRQKDPKKHLGLLDI